MIYIIIMFGTIIIRKKFLLFSEDGCAPLANPYTAIFVFNQIIYNQNPNSVIDLFIS